MTGLIFNNAQSTREVSAGKYKTEAALQALVVAALATAIATGELFTTTVSVSDKTAQDVQNVTRIFVDNGFGVSLSGSTLTLTW